MRPLSSAELFQVWEEGLSQPLLEKMLRLLAKACSADDVNDIGRLSIGERDARLLQLREWMFGTSLKNITTCPHCSESVEWESETESLHLQKVNSGLSFRTFSLEKDSFRVQFRLPDSHDMLKILEEKNSHADSRKLLSDCILEIDRNGDKYMEPELPESVWDALSQRMEEEDPQADIRMQMNCPNCSHQWEARFDIMSFFWAEINNWARRVMQDVCLLARSFGWPEKDILSMSVRRRQLYIEMIRG